MIEEQLCGLAFHDLIKLINRVLENRDEVSDYRRSGIRLAQFVHYTGEPVNQDLIGVADWRNVDIEDRDEFAGHLAEQLVQAGTCDSCLTEIVSYSKSAKCPVCGVHVECT